MNVFIHTSYKLKQNNIACLAHHIKWNPRRLPQMFSSQMIDWARDKQTKAQDQYLYLQHENYLCRMMERKSDHPADCQSPLCKGKSIKGRVSQSVRASEITIIHHQRCLLQVEPAVKQTIEDIHRCKREGASGCLKLWPLGVSPVLLVAQWELIYS